VGCGGWEGHLLSSALGDDRPAGLTRAWRALLQAALPQPALPGYYELLESLTQGARTGQRLDDVVAADRVQAPVISGHGLAASSS